MTLPRIRDAAAAGAIDEAVAILGDGGVVALPTETVYGLAGLTHQPRALESIYRLKGRPSNNPLIAHVLDVESAHELVGQGAFNPLAERLAARFWPGPLTLVLDRAGDVPAQATGGLDSIALRAPAHPVAREVLVALGAAFSAPSANRSGSVSPTTAEHVALDLAGEDLLVLDGGPCRDGLESTVVDLRDPDRPMILRPGAIGLEALGTIAADVEVLEGAAQGASPGTALHHYATSTPLSVVESFDDAGHQDVVIRFNAAAPAGVGWDYPLGGDPVQAAHALYATLRSADTHDAQRILVEAPPRQEAWRAIADRLHRAANSSQRA